MARAQTRRWARRWTAVGIGTVTGLTTFVGLAAPAFAGTALALPGSVDGGGHHSLLVVAPSGSGGNQVYATGLNADGQLGNGTTTDSSTFVKVPGLSGVRAVAANGYLGGGFSLALKHDGTVWAWGEGPLGNPSHVGADGLGESHVPVQVSGITNATAIDAGADHAIAVLADGTVKTWGANHAGGLGTGTTNPSPGPVTVLTGVSTGHGSVAAGWEYSAAVMANGTVKTWGYGANGRLGTGNTVNSTIPVTVPGVANATLAEAKMDATLVRLSDGTVRGWGYNYSGLLGTDSGGDVLTPEVANSGEMALHLALGWNNSLATRRTTLGTIEVRMSGLFPGQGFPHISPGHPTAISTTAQDNALIVHPDGSVWGQGFNPSGELGVGDTDPRHGIVAVPKTW
ncbi:RCC1 domain-containing protein [Thermomonospora umbrina]|uniref:RCC1 domain-containing protein n=1 Tax=Thermomonospora umbrina TaxID=111806 RepID=UPI0014772E07|nr:hypothetical protein [Thermomonospora umbrina]